MLSHPNLKSRWCGSVLGPATFLPTSECDASNLQKHFLKTLLYTCLLLQSPPVFPHITKKPPNEQRISSQIYLIRFQSQFGKKVFCLFNFQSNRLKKEKIFLLHLLFLLGSV